MWQFSAAGVSSTSAACVNSSTSKWSCWAHLDSIGSQIFLDEKFVNGNCDVLVAACGSFSRCSTWKSEERQSTEVSLRGYQTRCHQSVLCFPDSWVSLWCSAGAKPGTELILLGTCICAQILMPVSACKMPRNLKTFGISFCYQAQLFFADSWQALYMTLVFALIVMLLGSEAPCGHFAVSVRSKVDDVVFLNDSKIVACQNIYRFYMCLFFPGVARALGNMWAISISFSPQCIISTIHAINNH